MKVRALMNPLIINCNEATPLSEAARLMRERDIGFLPVMAPTDQRRIIGVLTDRDALLAAVRRGQHLDRMTVGQAMTRRLHTCHADDDVAVLHRTMREHRIRRVPVLDQTEQAAGIVSLNDLALNAQTAKDREEVAGTLAAICAHQVVLSEVPHGGP